MVHALVAPASAVNAVENLRVRARGCIGFDNSALRAELGLREDVLARYARTRVGVWQARALTSQNVRKGVALGAPEGNDNSGTKQERATPDHAPNDNRCPMGMQRLHYPVIV